MRSRVFHLVLCVALLGGCGKKSNTDDPVAAPVVLVHAQYLEERLFEDSVTGSGQWRSSGEVVIGAPFAGVVHSLAVRPGDHVSSGDTLGWLETRESRASIRGAELLSRGAHDDSSRVEARRALALARRELVRVPLVAGNPGIVLRRTLEPGAQVAESGEVLAIVPLASMVFEAHIPPSPAARVRRGQQAIIREEGRPPRAAKVERMLPAASAGDQASLAWLAPTGAGPYPEIDRFGTATITLGAPKRALAVPDSAVVQDDLTGETRIAVVDSGGTANWVDVVLGVNANGWRELHTPVLSTRTRVIIEGQHGLPDSTRVRLAP